MQTFCFFLLYMFNTSRQ